MLFTSILRFHFLSVNDASGLLVPPPFLAEAHMRMFSLLRQAVAPKI